MEHSFYNNNNNLHKSYIFKSQSSEKFIQISEIWVYKILVSLIAGLCYLNSLHGDFLHDDVFAIKKNKDVTGESPILDLFSNDFWGKHMSDPTSHKSYRPLCILTFRINYWLGHGSPYSFHVFNVCLHVVATFLFAVVCQYVVCLPPTCCLMAGALFAVHPIHTEAVSGIVGRADVLAAIFFMLSLLLYVRSLEIRWYCDTAIAAVQSWSQFSVSLVCAGLAMLCKEQGVTVLGVCILYDVLICSRRIIIHVFRSTERQWHPIIPLVTRISIVVVVISMLLLCRILLMNGNLPKFSWEDNPASFSSSILTRGLTYSYLWFFNAWILLFPTTLCYDWQVGSIPLVESLWDPRNLETAGFLFTLVLLIIKWGHYVKTFDHNVPDEILCGLLLLVVPFLPASNIFLRVGFVVAERVLYISSTGYCILVAYGVYQLRQRFYQHRGLVTALFLSLLVTMAAKCYKQNMVWQTRLTLFRSGVQTLPQNAKAHYNFANYLSDISRTEEAIHHYEISVSLYPDNPSAHNNLGTLLHNTSMAEYHFREALRVLPRHKGAMTNLGALLYKRGERAEGNHLILQALDVDPRYQEALLTQAGIMAEEKKWKEAEKYYQLVIQDNPNNAQVILQYGKYLHLKGDMQEAIKFYKKAYQLDSHQSAAIVNAANALRQIGSTREAEDMLNRIISVHRDIHALQILGLVYLQQDRMQESRDIFKELLQADPHNVDVAINYVHSIAGTGRVDEAERVLSEILSKHPNNTDVLMQMANILGKQSKHHQALMYVEAAIVQAKKDQNNDLLAKFLFQKGNHYKDLRLYNEAFKWYNETVTLNPYNTEAQLNVGTIHHINGNLAMARHHYTLVLKQNPDNKTAKENFEKLKRVEMEQKMRKNT